MPFIGQEPLTGAYHVLDSITASATATYNLQLNSGAFSPASANQLLVSLNGVIQKPGSSFTISGSQITFSSALTSSDSIDFIIALGDVLSVGTPTDGTVTTNKIANDAVTGAKIENNPTIAGNLGVNGITTSVGTIVASSGVAIGGTGSANTLDDYEEGTFTPTFNQGFASPTYSIQVGRYTKIGQTVQFHLHIDINTVGSASSAQWKLGGLPFTSLNVANVWGGAFSIYTGGVHDDSFSNKVYWAIGPGQTTVLAYKASGGTYPATSVSAPTGGFYIAGQYLTAS